MKNSRHLDSFFEGLKRNVTLVVHDWDSALGLHWAARHPEAAVKGIAYTQAIVSPLQWSEWSKRAVEIFKASRSPAGDDMIFENNIFDDRILPGSIMRKLDDEEMNASRKPFLEVGESRRPTLNVTARNSDRRRARRCRRDGQQAFEVARKKRDAKAIHQCRLVLHPDGRAARVLPDMAKSTQGDRQGRHFIQEDSPHEIGDALADWYKSL